VFKISAFLFNTSVDSHESPTTFSCCDIISRQCWPNLTGLWTSMHQQVPCTRKNDILCSWLIACCKLAPTSPEKRDVIMTSSAAMNIYFLHFQNLPFLWYIHYNIFVLNPHIIREDMKENVSGCFFLNTVYVTAAYSIICHRSKYWWCCMLFVHQITITINRAQLTHMPSSTTSICRR